jgi:hypothetical protein
MGDSEKTQLQSIMVNDIIPQTINTIPEPNVSASKIQNAFRNRLARIKLAEAKAGDVMTQINREREQKAYNQKAKENKSATKLQSAFRNRLARIKLAEAKAGDVMTQINREREQKEYNQKAKLNKAAKKIQNMVRNKKIYDDAVAAAVERDWNREYD